MILAEISDKELQPLTFWLVFVPLSITTVLLSWRRHWLALSLLALSAMGAVWFIWSGVLRDPLYAEIIREMGVSYLWNEIIAACLPFLSMLIVVLLQRRGSG